MENRKHGVPRIDHLRAAPAAVRFLSVEPLLEDLGQLNLDGISWVIVGGESGNGARPMDKQWVLALRDQCHEQTRALLFQTMGRSPQVRRGPKAGRQNLRRLSQAYPATRAGRTTVFRDGPRNRSSVPLRQSHRSFDPNYRPTPTGFFLASGR